MQAASGIYEFLFVIFSFIAVLGVPITAAVCFVVFLVKYKKCSDVEKKKLMKTNAVIFGAMSGGFIISLLLAVWFSTKTIAYM